jgi:hypothetical protein
MKPCAYRGQRRGERYDCWNTKDLVHLGTVAKSTCERCPYARQPDFFAQTERLSVQVSGRPYRPAPASCGGCGTVKRRESVTQFVWPYWHGGANGDEIRFSVRSVETFFDGPVKCTIVGDRPPWYQGHVIHQPQIPLRENHGFRDMLAKMWVMATHPEIDADFVWMMDDIYLLKPVTWDDLEMARAYPWQEDVSNSWQRRKSNTMRALRDRGRTNHDYATHLPHTVEKAKLRQVYEEFDLHQNCMLWEVAYGNTFRGRPYSVNPFFARIQQHYSAEQLQRVTAGASVMNHLASCWTPAMREFLETLLPIATQSETIEAGYQPSFKRVARTGPRVVKRRPAHTHKANQVTQ